MDSGDREWLTWKHPHLGEDEIEYFLERVGIIVDSARVNPNIEYRARMQALDELNQHRARQRNDQYLQAFNPVV